MKTLKQIHAEYIARVKAGGRKTLVYESPCCAEKIEDPAAGKGETWDTLATCPHCGEIYWKVTTDTKIVGSLHFTNDGKGGES